VHHHHQSIRHNTTQNRPSSCSKTSFEKESNTKTDTFGTPPAMALLLLLMLSLQKNNHLHSAYTASHPPVAILARGNNDAHYCFFLMIANRSSSILKIKNINCGP